MGRLPVVLALTPDAEREVEHAVFGREAVLEVKATVAEADELQHDVAIHGASVLVSPDLSGLTAAHCARVRARGLRVVGLARNARERKLLDALGVDEVVAPDDSGPVILGALRGPRDEPVASTSGEPALARPRADEASESVIAVIGSKGAPGASECAASLSVLAAERWLCSLVELDALGGGLDLRLGADPREGSVLGLARAVLAGDGALGELLERWLTARDGWPPALVGPPDPARALDELARPGVAAAVVRALASLYPVVVADVGFVLAEGDEAGPACRVHREALVAADVVLLVIGAREEQVRAGLDQLDALLRLGIPPERMRVALNGTGGPGATATIPLEQIVQAQLAERRFALDAWLPWDRRALARARRTGLPLARARRRGVYARALRRLLDELFLPVAPAPRGRKLLLDPPRTHELERVVVP